MSETSRDVPYCLCLNITLRPSHPSVPKGHMGHQGTYGTSRDVSWCPSAQSSVPHPSIPKGHIEHQGMSHGVPQHNPLSHLSIPSLSPQGTYETSRDVSWCPSAQSSVPPVHPIPQSPRDIWGVSYVVGGCNVMSMADILCLDLVLQATPFPHSANRFQ